MNRVPLVIKLFILVFFISFLFSAYSCFSMSNMDSESTNNDSKPGSNLFKANCSGCHLNGQNLIKADKPIIASLKLKTKQSFVQFLESPPPPMPNFKNIVSMPAQLDSLYSYVTFLMGN